MEEEGTVAPIHKTVTVSCSIERAFRAFTEEIDRWWPIETHSIHGDGRNGARAKQVVMDGRPGGRLYEVTSDGREAKWADVLVWDPPHRLVLAWQPNPKRPAATEVEITFADVDGQATRVDLVHGGWERLGDQAAAARAGYNDWEMILGRYARSVDASR